MLRIIILGFAVCALPALASSAALEPFWKRKAVLFERIQAGEVLVSVSTASMRDGLTQLWLRGGGHVKTPREFVWASAQKYEDLPRASGGYIKTAQWDAATSRLRLHVEAYGYSSQMVVHLSTDKSTSPWKLRYEVIEGPMTGMMGTLTFEEFKSHVCEVGLTGEYKGKKPPIPRMFLSFGMEAMLKFMAVRMRSFVQSEFRQSRTVDKSTRLVEESAP